MEKAAGDEWLIYTGNVRRLAPLTIFTGEVENVMENRIEALKAATIGRYRIFTEETVDCFEIICLDQKYNLVTNRRISRAQMKNSALMTAIYGDLRQKLGCH